MLQPWYLLYCPGQKVMATKIGKPNSDVAPGPGVFVKGFFGIPDTK
jgi:hypothetical protein